MGGAFSLFVPASVTAVRGIVLALGGPDTRPFANPSRSFNLPATVPLPESELMAMGTDHRLRAREDSRAGLWQRTVVWFRCGHSWLEEAAAMARVRH
jgi:hypothetical protein